MEPLKPHQREILYDYDGSSGIERRFIWDSYVQLAYTQVEEHKTGKRYDSFPREEQHPRKTFEQPETQIVAPLPSQVLESLDGRATE